MNGCDFTPSTRTQSSEQENSYLTASKRHPSTSHTRNTPNAFPKLFFGRLPGFIENLLESANLFCNAAGATQTALGVRQLCFNFFALSFFNKFGIHSSWEAEQRDTPVVGAFTPVSLVVYGEWGWSIYQSFDALPKRHDTWHQGCSEAGTRGNGVPTPFSCFDLKVLLALHPCLTHAISQTIRRSKFS